MATEPHHRHGKPTTVVPLWRALRRRLERAATGTMTDGDLHALRILQRLAQDRREAFERTTADEALDVVAAIHADRCWCSLKIKNAPPGHLRGCELADELDKAGTVLP